VPPGPTESRQLNRTPLFRGEIRIPAASGETGLPSATGANLSPREMELLTAPFLDCTREELPLSHLLLHMEMYFYFQPYPSCDASTSWLWVTVDCAERGHNIGHSGGHKVARL